MSPKVQDEYGRIEYMPEFVIDPKSVAFAIITSYPKWYQGKLRSIKHIDKVRGDLALDFFKKVVDMGYNVLCVDGNSSKSFSRELKDVLGTQITKRKVPGRGANKREAIRRLSNVESVKVIILTEAEKVSLVTDCMPEIVAPIVRGDADIVVPKRKEALFKSLYPDYMYESESEGNNIYNETLRLHGILKKDTQDLDFFFGPRVFRNDSRTRALFMKRYKLRGESLMNSLYDPDAHSNILCFPIISALRKNMSVKSVEVPFIYPKKQKENEEIGNREIFIVKRNQQKTDFLLNLLHFLNFIEKKKGPTRSYLQEVIL